MCSQIGGNGNNIWCELSDSYIANGTGLTENTIKKYIISLMNNGWVIKNSEKKKKAVYDEYEDSQKYAINQYRPLRENLIKKEIKRNQEQELIRIMDDIRMKRQILECVHNIYSLSVELGYLPIIETTLYLEFTMKINVYIMGKYHIFNNDLIYV